MAVYVSKGGHYAVTHAHPLPLPGCCVDRESGTEGACVPETCMTLPAGQTCGTCVHARRCITIFGMTEDDTSCSFFPRRFRQAPERACVSEAERPSMRER